MDVLLGIGDFSRTTYLSIKALRHYHDIGVLVPARVDPATGYRYYRTGQVATAQVIRRFRDLGMPLDDIRTIVQSHDVSTRNETIVGHLARMESQLEQTREAVSSLRALLDRGPVPLNVERRSVPTTPTFAIVERVAGADVVGWWVEAFTELHRAARQMRAERTGPDGMLFPTEFFESEKGELVAFVPANGTPPRGRIESLTLPAAELAVALHHGPFSDLDQTYGALGTWVAEWALGAEGPVRENYLPLGDEDDLLHHDTEVCWPVSGDPE